MKYDCYIYGALNFIKMGVDKCNNCKDIAISVAATIAGVCILTPLNILPNSIPGRVLLVGR